MARRRSAWSRLSVWTLIASNLVPLYGVLVHGWSVFGIMLLFWLENVVIGLLNVARMAVAKPPGPQGESVKWFFIPFFCVHYGVFTLVHGIFVFVLFREGGLEGAAETAAAAEPFHATSLLFPLGALVASHLVSFFTNFIGQGEYRQHSIARLMFTPYGRVVILHLTILGGGALAMSLGSPVWALAVLVVLKILVDLGAHLWEHRRIFRASPG